MRQIDRAAPAIKAEKVDAERGSNMFVGRAGEQMNERATTIGVGQRRCGPPRAIQCMLVELITLMHWRRGRLPDARHRFYSAN